MIVQTKEEIILSSFCNVEQSHICIIARQKISHLKDLCISSLRKNFSTSHSSVK